ncbi:hypothetical protein [Actinomadura livida]|uniref:AcrR family transcriptional regulator n=1 Tax=Actinomadura livida TaxID=79909 RepID=A0A7W7IEM7_9ACTN|nr:MULTISPECIES: hypothetical protein [Actinomadura]MBB4775704.1 AcrR family transcriptional regulator [Actinomadura catellatispora]GGU34535.1 hypothetical protein GCM10010208_68920 [Actinomadura livida]
MTHTSSATRGRTATRRPAYNEFGNKIGLGRALVEREIDMLVGGVQERLDQHLDDLPAAVQSALGFVFLTEVIAMFGSYADRTWPAVPAGVRSVLVETLLRVTISHVVAPLQEPEAVARDLGALTRRLVAPADVCGT